ncbi:MAG: SPFH domain-containing protein [Phycisphaerales bacterium]|jgi:membrane protease subunit HflC|nr:SPFH domain-containing protein [Phycisphaerales bacterium]
MKRIFIIGIGLAIFIVLLLFSMTYTVSFHQVGILSRFGQTDVNSVIATPGLHFRLPFFADSVTLLDTRTQVRQSPLEMLQTKDGQQIVVKSYLLWNIDTNAEGPLNFYRSYSSLEAAQLAIDSQFRDAISVLSSYSFEDLTGANNDLSQAEDEILTRLGSLQASGIVPKAVGINRLLLPPKTTTAVLQRMQARRDTLAEQLRAKGKADAEAIRAAARAKREKIEAFASQRAEDIRAEGEKQAAVYLEKMGEYEELAVFLSWLDAVEIALSENTTLVLETNLAPWHLMDLSAEIDASGIPQPAEDGKRTK